MLPKDKEPNDDAELFRATVGEVRPLAAQNRITPVPLPRHAYIPDSYTAVEIADTLPDINSDVSIDEYIGNGISWQSLRKLKRGYWPIQDDLDLHGLHSDTARRTLQAFLHHALEQRFRCVLVIHGKGLNSKSGEAVLKIRTRHWLIHHPGVLAYCDSPARQGGSGAAIILLRISP